MAILGFYTPVLGWSRYRDANPVPTIPLTDNIASVPSGPVRYYRYDSRKYLRLW